MGCNIERKCDKCGEFKPAAFSYFTERLWICQECKMSVNNGTNNSLRRRFSKTEIAKSFNRGYADPGGEHVEFINSKKIDLAITEKKDDKRYIIQEVSLVKSDDNPIKIDILAIKNLDCLYQHHKDELISTKTMLEKAACPACEYESALSVLRNKSMCNNISELLTVLVKQNKGKE